LYPTRYLGQSPDWPFLNEEKKYALCQPLTNENGELVFEAEYKGEKHKYKPEAVMGVFFSKLKQNWIKKGYNIKDVVVSVPDYMIAHERNALVEAIKIADLNCTSLVNESSAISLNYGLFRRNQFDEKTPKIVGFVDMGETKTSVFFTSFTKNTHKVISVTTDRFCGARDIDYILMEHFGGKFKQKYGCDPLKSTKCKLRLLDTIAKMRKILTGNRETSLNIDSLMDDEDMNFMVTRDEFESLAAPIINKFRQTILNALAEAKLKVSDISSVEMVGDAVRIPILQQIVKETYGMELSKTLSPDECVARGTALYAAMNSPHFSLKDFNFEHCNTYSIIFEYPFVKNDQIEIRTTKLIQRNELFPSRKSIKFTEKQIPKETVLDLKFFYSQEEVTFLKNNLLKNYMISIPQVKEEQYTLVMEFYLDQNCLFTLDKAFINEVYYEDKVIPVTTTPTTTTTTPNTTTENTTTTTPTTETKPEEKVEKIKKERKTNCIIKLVNCTYGNNPSLLTSLIQREQTQENDDKTIKYVKDKRNELETFMYSTREKLQNGLNGFFDEKEAEILIKIMANTEEWMYNNLEETYVKEKIEEHYNLVTVPGNRIYRRKTHWENIDKAMIDAKASLNGNIKKFEEDNRLNKTETEDMKKVIEGFNDYYNITFPVCIKSPKFMDPPVDYANIEKATKEFEDKVKKIYSEADKRIREAEKKIQEAERKLREEEKKKQEEQAKAATTTSTEPTTTSGDQKMQVD
jgi:heat shock protein 4